MTKTNSSPKIFLLFLALLSFYSCNKSVEEKSPMQKSNDTEFSDVVLSSDQDVALKARAANIAVFVPGIIADSPVYQMLVNGVQQAVSETGFSNLTVSEAGTSQADWENKLTDLVASGKFDLIVSANPSIPSIAANISKNFPKQKFLLLNGTLEPPLPNIATFQYNQREQAYMAGYLSALISNQPFNSQYPESLAKSRGNHKIAIVAAQEYPDMNNIILPGFTEGAKAADPTCSVEFRIVGNWYDAGKATNIASSLYRDGVDVILPIAGGANQGVISAAQDLGFFIMWFDDAGYERAPGYIAGSSEICQDELARLYTTCYLFYQEDFFGQADFVGMKDEFVKFDDENEFYKKTIPEEIRDKHSKILNELRLGRLELPIKQ